MKKILVLAALGLLGLVSVVQAGPLVATHIVHKQVRFVTHSTATTAATVGAYRDYLYNSTNDAPYAIDSTVVWSFIKIDTSAAIATAGFAQPTGLVADSNFVARLTVSDAGGSGTLDSLYIAAEVSSDGLNWFRASAGAGPAVVGTFVLPGNLGSTRALRIATGTKAWSWSFSGAVFAGSSAAPSYSNQIFTWPLVRFIISGARTGTNAHNLRATLSYLSADEDLNK